MHRECTSMIRVYRGFIAAVTAIFCISLFFGGSLPFYLFYAMSFMLLISYFYIRQLRSAFEVEISCSDTLLSAGAASKVFMKIRFNIPLPVPYIEIESEDFNTVRSTAWDENIWIESSKRFYQRGAHSLSNVFVKVTDLFHISSFEKTVCSDTKINVYPHIYKIKPITLSGLDIYREAADLRSRSEDPHTIKDVRKYREGDSIKKIHWKLSAKQDDLYVKNLDTISGEEIVLFVDMHSKNYSFDTKGIIEESIVDFSASIINQMIVRNLNIKVLLNTSAGRYFELNDRAGFNRLMDFLLLQKSDGATDLSQYIYENSSKLHRMNKIAIVVSELDPGLVGALMGMSSSGYSFSVFYCVEDQALTAYSEELRKAQVECCYFKDYIEG